MNRVCGKQIGSVTHIKAIAIANNIKVERREQKIFETERREILQKLADGSSTQEIAKQVNISIGAVEQILTQHPELKNLRKRIRFLNKRKEHRDKLSKALDKPGLTRKAVKEAVPTSYIWLFKHDKAWLYQQLPPEIPRKQHSKKTK